MKIYNYLIIISFSSLIACNSEKEEWGNSDKLSAMKELMDDHVLLKQAEQKGDTWLFRFETETVALPASTVKTVTPDVDNWKTLVCFSNNQSLTIPTVGADIERFVGNIEVNPSGLNPLAATVQISLPALGRVKVIVHSKKGNRQPDVEYTFKSITARQSLTVLGLYPDYNNQVELIYLDKTGKIERGRKLTSIQTKPVECRAFKSLRVVTVESDKMESGMNLINSPGLGEADTSVPFMVDADGELRWILLLDGSEMDHVAMQGGLCRMENGNYLAGDANYNRILEVDVLGNVLRKWELTSLGYQYHHEVMEAKNGNFLITVSKINAFCADKKTTRVNDHIVEFNPNTNKLVHEWDLAHTLDSARYHNVDASTPGEVFGHTQGNWAHNNAIEDWGDSYLATARFQGIFKFDKKGTLDWIISPHKNWREQYKKYLLTPLDKNGNPITDPDVINGDKNSEDFEWIWGVHTPVLMPNGHILAFDNGYCRNFIARSLMEHEQYSRVVEYEVDEVNRTVRQVWQYGKDRQDCYAPARSSVQYLEKTGNVLFASAMQNKLSNGSFGAHVIEINPATNKVVYELELITAVFHRAKRISLYPDNL